MGTDNLLPLRSIGHPRLFFCEYTACGPTFASLFHEEKQMRSGQVHPQWVRKYLAASDCLDRLESSMEDQQRRYSRLAASLKELKTSIREFREQTNLLLGPNARSRKVVEIWRRDGMGADSGAVRRAG
jgi:hypothetical protein